MQVDDEHLSLTDQKDQVRDALRALLRFNVSGWGSERGGEASAGRQGVKLSGLSPPFPLHPLRHGMGPLEPTLVGDFSKLQTLNLAFKE